MSDTPMPETLESLAAKITALSEVVKAGFTDFAGRFNQVEERFDKVDERFDKIDGRLVTVDGRLNKVEERLDQADDRFTSLEASIDRKLDEMRSQLGVKIEAVDTRVTQVYDAVIALGAHGEQNRKDHKRIDEKLEDHDVRILALEHRGRPKRRPR